MVARVLAIAGSDPSGGAGIQADLKTFSAYGVYGMTAITALTVQNTLGVTRVALSDPQLVLEQMTAVLEDIGIDAIKIGMLGDSAIVAGVSKWLASGPRVPVVLDPVMVSTSGDRLFGAQAEERVIASLLAHTTIVTPNLPEASVLAGIPVQDREDMVRAAEIIAGYGVAYVLVKGGHLPDQASDLLWHHGETQWFDGTHIVTNNTHGTGCTLSSAIAAGLAQGWSMTDAVGRAKGFVTEAILAAPGLGLGHGPLWHHGGTHA